MRQTNRTKYDKERIGPDEKREIQLKPSVWAKIEAKEYDINSEHPTPEQLLVREAVKFLTPKQRAVWEYYNYDRLTEDEIAKKVGITRDSVHDRIVGAEKKITKWCQSNMGAYKLLKSDLGKE